MEFKDAVRARYSCRKFADRQVEAAALDAILEAGRWAPTAKNAQEHHVYAVQSAEMLAKVDEVTPCRYGAPTCLVMTYDPAGEYVYPGGQQTSGAEDVTIVATHMALAAADEGVNSCWVNNLDPAKMAAALGIPENERVVLMLDLGYAADPEGTSPNHDSRKELAETVTFL